MLLIADIIVFVLFIVLPFGLSFLFKKNKAVGISLRMLSGILLIWFVHDLVGKNSFERQGEKEIVGTYKLNVDSSKFENIDLKKYTDITLTVRSNNSFIISRPIPCLNCTSGKWNLLGDGEMSVVEYQFDNEKYSHQMFPYNYWTFEGLDLKGAIDDDKIVFTRN